MIETFVRRPVGAGEFVADAVRVVGVLSAVVVAVGWGPVKAALLALALLGLVIPRLLGVRPAFDIALCVSILVASWCSVLDLYATVQPIDLPVHLVLNGLLAAIGYTAFVRTLLPEPAADGRGRAAVVVITAGIGALLGVLWELGEWAGHTYLDDSIFVGYDDTIGDLVIGLVGSLAAGVLMPWLAAESRFRSPTPATAGTAPVSVRAGERSA